MIDEGGLVLGIVLVDIRRAYLVCAERVVRRGMQTGVMVGVRSLAVLLGVFLQEALSHAGRGVRAGPLHRRGLQRVVD